MDIHPRSSAPYDLFLSHEKQDKIPLESFYLPQDSTHLREHKLFYLDIFCNFPELSPERIHNHEVPSSILGPATRKHSRNAGLFSFIHLTRWGSALCICIYRHRFQVLPYMTHSQRTQPADFLHEPYVPRS